jgi:hypothetical protein
MARLRIRLGSDGRPSAAVVVLSRRNLLALLHKIERPGSSGGFVNHDVEIDGGYAPGFGSLVLSEDDTDHYSQRPDPPGRCARRPKASSARVAAGAGRRARGT